MDSRIGRVLDIYHEMIETERNSPRDMPPGTSQTHLIAAHFYFCTRRQR
ncbi:hypothetical protein [Rhizobium phaseoli]|nr:hypothetical protein [Rhizobium phaseoli]